MAVMSFGKHKDSPEYSEDYKGKYLTETWLAQVSSHLDDEGTVLTVFPLRGSEHPSKFGFYLKKRSINRTDPNAKMFEVKLEYSTPVDGDPGTQPGSETGEEGEDPTFEFPTIRKSSEEITEPASWFYDENDEPFSQIITSSAGEIYVNAQERKSYIRVIEISKNFSIETDDNAMDTLYGGHLNSAPWWGYPAGTVLMMPISMERKQLVIEGGTLIPYMTLDFTFKYKATGWDLILPDIGNFYVDPINGFLQDFQDNNGNNVLGLLDGSGGPLCEQGGGEVEPEIPCLQDPVMLPAYKLYPSADFNDLPIPVNNFDFRGWHLT